MGNNRVVTRKKLNERMQNILETFCVVAPHIDLVNDYYTNKNAPYDLQHWVCNNLKPEFSYATGLSICESTQLIAESQIDNGLEVLG